MKTLGEMCLFLVKKFLTDQFNRCLDFTGQHFVTVRTFFQHQAPWEIFTNRFGSEQSAAFLLISLVHAPILENRRVDQRYC